jgi:hypothetical protein
MEPDLQGGNTRIEATWAAAILVFLPFGGVLSFRDLLISLCRRRMSPRPRRHLCLARLDRSRRDRDVPKQHVGKTAAGFTGIDAWGRKFLRLAASCRSGFVVA